MIFSTPPAAPRALVFATLLLAPAAAAQAPIPAPLEARAVRASGAAPEIDGRLDDAAWEQAPVITGFRQKVPDEGAPASERTELRFVYDDHALYIGARMHSAHPASIQAPVGRRDQGGEADQLLVSLDTWLDRRTAWTFGVTAAGVRLDSYHPSDTESVQDASFDPVWDARTRVDSAGWTAEMRIPFSQLRFNRGASQRWGMNARRVIPARNEESYWVQIPRSVTAWASRFGELAGLEGIPAARRIELAPYVATALAVPADPQAGNPFTDESERTLRGGADLKAGLGPNLTFQATVNPDFGQVELDPAEVNLTAFETFFSERRPFFTEGSDVFRFGHTRAFNRYGSQEYFYSRRIGRSPQRVLGGADVAFVDAPQQTRILGAAKVSGRTPGGWTLGVMDALTGRESARFVDAEGERRSAQVEPLSNYFVGRVRRDMRDGQTVVQLLASRRQRSTLPWSPLVSTAGISRPSNTAGRVYCDCLKNLPRRCDATASWTREVFRCGGTPPTAGPPITRLTELRGQNR